MRVSEVSTHFARPQGGLTLVELVVFIAVVALAAGGVMLVYATAVGQSSDPMVRIRTVELAQALLDEVQLKGYDDATPVGGGCVRFPAGSSNCVTGPAATAQNASAFGPDAGESRATFDDVDDYHNLGYCGAGASLPAGSPCTGGCQALVDEAGNDISGRYAGFAVCLRVAFAGGDLGAVSPGAGTSAVRGDDAKRIDLLIADPVGSRMTFSTYRLNY